MARETAVASEVAVVVVDGRGGGKARSRKPVGTTGGAHSRAAALSVFPPSFEAPPSPPPSDEEDLDISFGSVDGDDAEPAKDSLAQPSTGASTGAAAPPVPALITRPRTGLAPALVVFTEPFPAAEGAHKRVLGGETPIAESPTASLAESPDADTVPPLPTAASVHDRRPSAFSDRSFVSRLLPPTAEGAPPLSSFSSEVGSPSLPKRLDGPSSSPQGYIGSAPTFIRRHTTGSPVTISSPLAPSAETLSTTVAGVDSIRLDTDILTNAETVRRRRISRRTKRTQSHDNLVATGRGGASVEVERGRIDDDARVGVDLAGPGPATTRSRLGSIHQRKQGPHQFVDEGHDNFVLMYDMLTGIRIGVRPFRALDHIFSVHY